MQIGAVEAIEVDGPTGALADRAIGELSQTADLQERRGNLVRSNAEHLKRSALHEQVRAEASDFRGDGVSLAEARFARRFGLWPAFRGERFHRGSKTPGGAVNILAHIGSAHGFPDPHR